VIDTLEIGQRGADGEVVAMGFTEDNGPAYPFSLAEKLERITEPHPWYTPEGAAASPWGRAIVPMEMISVLAKQVRRELAGALPALGLFLDLEIRLLDGPCSSGSTTASNARSSGSPEPPHRVLLDQDGAERHRHRRSCGRRPAALRGLQGVLPRVPEGPIVLSTGVSTSRRGALGSRRLRGIRPEVRDPSRRHLAARRSTGPAGRRRCSCGAGPN